MEITFTVAPEKSFGTVTITGKFDLDTFRDFYKQMVSHPDFSSGMSVIWDVRQADISKISQDEMRTVGNNIAYLTKERGSGKGALVVSDDISFGVSRMGEMMTEKFVTVTVRVFRNMENAVKWINEK